MIVPVGFEPLAILTAFLERRVPIRVLIDQISHAPSHGDAIESKAPEICLFPNSDAEQEAKRIFELCDKLGHRIISWWDPDYPANLKAIASPPFVLFARGTHVPGATGVVAMVGTRRASQYGKLVAEKFAQTFADHDLTVCSGMATGIDTYSHKAALKAGKPTIAVIASALDKISGSLAIAFAEEVSGHGVVISEHPPGVAALPVYFARRNRIISGISDAVVVVESGLKGGSLITANFAIDQGKPLFAIPGPINSDRSNGTNDLIRRGHARMATSPLHVLQAIGIEQNALGKPPVSETDLEPDEAIVLDVIVGSPIHLDTIAEATGKTTADLLVILLQLEFLGLIRQYPGQLFGRAL